MHRRAGSPRDLTAWALCTGTAKAFPRTWGGALALITDAAGKGFDQALVALFYMYRDGCGTDCDMKKALEFLKKAAEKGNEEAISRLEDLSPEQSDDLEK